MRPHVGQSVLYWPRPAEMSIKHKQPFMAFVTHVHTDTVVNLFVVSDNGIPFVRANTTLRSSDVAGEGECCAPPYDRRGTPAAPFV